MPKKQGRAARGRKGSGGRKAAVAGRRPTPRRRTGVDEALVEKTVAMLREHDRGVVASKRAIGEHLFMEYFDGDEANVRSRDRFKSKTFGRLAERAAESTFWSERDLREAVTIALCARSLPTQVADAIDASYFPLLDGIEDLEVRVHVATRIASKELRGEAARDAIRAAAGKRRGGPVPDPEAVAGAAELARDTERLALKGVFDRDALSRLSAAHLEDVRITLRAAQDRMEDFARAIGEATRPHHQRKAD